MDKIWGYAAAMLIGWGAGLLYPGGAAEAAAPRPHILARSHSDENAGLKDSLAERRAPTEPTTRSIFDEGVDLYAQGRVDEARGRFEDVLRAEPDNVEARNALRRILTDSEGAPLGLE